MTLRRSWPIDKGLPNALDLRNIERYKYTAAGILPFGDTNYNPTRALLSAGTGWGVSIAAFLASLKRAAATDGTSYVSNDAAVTNAVTLSGAPTTGSRIDVVYVWSPDPTKGDSLVTPSGESLARAVPVFGVLVGTAANGGLGTSPTKPSLATYAPDGALELGTVTIPSTATSITSSGVVIANTFPWSTAIGDPFIFRSATEAGASPYASQAQQIGQEAWVGGVHSVWTAAGKFSTLGAPVEGAFTMASGVTQSANSYVYNNPDGTTELNLQCGGSFAANVQALLLATLSTSYRPTANIFYPIAMTGSNTPSNGVVQVSPNGQILLFNNGAAHTSVGVFAKWSRNNT